MDIRAKIQELGGDIFVKELGGDRRIKPNESWNSFSRDLLVWFNSEVFGDHEVEKAAEVLNQMPRLKFLRVSGCSLTPEGYHKLRRELSHLNIEYTEFTANNSLQLIRRANAPLN